MKKSQGEQIMENSFDKLPIGVFDSGIGGISLLAELVSLMKRENYLYLSDTANAPYGTKSCDCIKEVSLTAARLLFSKGIKALVVACNTATSAAISQIREEFDIPVIGMEPAIKPAVETNGKGKILVLATPLTLKEAKFNNLFRRFNCRAEIIPVPCPGLVELIESEARPEKITQYLSYTIGSINRVNYEEVSTVVLGCTHYCFIRKEISEVIGPQAVIIDGNKGTARHVKRTLQEAGLLADKQQAGIQKSGVHRELKPHIEFLATGDFNHIIPLSERFFIKSMKIINNDGMCC